MDADFLCKKKQENSDTLELRSDATGRSPFGPLQTVSVRKSTRGPASASAAVFSSDFLHQKLQSSAAVPTLHCRRIHAFPACSRNKEEKAKEKRREVRPAHVIRSRLTDAPFRITCPAHGRKPRSFIYSDANTFPFSRFFCVSIFE